jgi:Domain of unknown function (DUF4386)
MNRNSLFRFAGWSAYVSAGATIFGFVTLITFFIVGDPYGIMNDVSSVVIVLSALPVLFALYQIHRSAAPTASLATLIIGVIAALSTSVYQIIFIITRKTYGDSVTLSYGIFGISLVMYSYLALRDKMLPRGLAWFGIVAGIGYVLVITGFIVGGPDHPLTYVGGLASIIGYPTWAIWLGRLFLSDKLSMH